jgi:putative aldouronate transport system permease protein
MAAPGTVLLILFVLFPIVGIYISFAAYRPLPGTGFFDSLFQAQFVGFYYFADIFARPDFIQVLFNTVLIAVIKIILQTVFGILLALLLNEVMQSSLKRVYQTAYFLPFFLSWALLGTIITEMLSIDGVINSIFNTDVSFLASNKYFRSILIITDLWKNAGYQAVYFLAAITCIDSTQYEAASIDGANKLKQCRHVTIPGIMPIIILVSVLNIGNIMNAGFEQVLVMYNPLVYATGDIIDTMAYRIGFLTPSIDQFSIGTAIGLFKSSIGCVLFVISYLFAAKKLNYSIM